MGEGFISYDTRTDKRTEKYLRPRKIVQSRSSLVRCGLQSLPGPQTYINYQLDPEIHTQFHSLMNILGQDNPSKSTIGFELYGVEGLETSGVMTSTVRPGRFSPTFLDFSNCNGAMSCWVDSLLCGLMEAKRLSLSIKCWLPGIMGEVLGKFDAAGGILDCVNVNNFARKDPREGEEKNEKAREGRLLGECCQGADRVFEVGRW